MKDTNLQGREEDLEAGGVPCEISVVGFNINDIQRKRSEPIKINQVQKEHQQGQGPWPDGWVRLNVAELNDIRRDTNWKAVEEYLARAMDWVKFSVAELTANKKQHKECVDGFSAAEVTRSKRRGQMHAPMLQRPKTKDQVAQDSRKIPTWQPKKEDIAKAKQRKDQKRQEHREGQVELSMNTTELVRLRSW